MNEISCVLVPPQLITFRLLQQMGNRLTRNIGCVRIVLFYGMEFFFLTEITSCAIKFLSFVGSVNIFCGVRT